MAEPRYFTLAVRWTEDDDGIFVETTPSGPVSVMVGCAVAAQLLGALLMSHGWPEANALLTAEDAVRAFDRAGREAVRRG